MKPAITDLWTGWRTGPARAGLAFASLALGLFAVTVLLATLDALQRQAQALVQAFGAGAIELVHSTGTTGSEAWNRKQVELFRVNLGEAGGVSGVKMLSAPAGADFTVAATDEHLADVRNWRVGSGRSLDGLDVRQGARQAMAPLGLCRRKHWCAGDLIELGPQVFRLAGCLDTGGDPAPGLAGDVVFIPYTADLLETGGEDALERVDMLLFRAEKEAPEALRRRVAALVAQPGSGAEGIEWITPETLLGNIRRWQRAIGWTAGTGGALGLLLGAATLAGMLLSSVRERVPEIGLRRALGARRGEIAGLFVAEALVLAGTAAFTGLLAAAGALTWLGTKFPLPFHFGFWTCLYPLAMAGVLGVLCSIGPAWLAARLPPAEALRNE